jgi:hypothetical protein
VGSAASYRNTEVDVISLVVSDDFPRTTLRVSGAGAACPALGQLLVSIRGGRAASAPGLRLRAGRPPPDLRGAMPAGFRHERTHVWEVDLVELLPEHRLHRASAQRTNRRQGSPMLICVLLFDPIGSSDLRPARPHCKVCARDASIGSAAYSRPSTSRCRRAATAVAARWVPADC